MANIVYKSYNQDSGYLFPYYLEDLIPTNHPVRVVNEIVNKLDISAVEASYKGGGASCYNPRMMLKVIIYSYLNNVYSGRMMEKKLQEEVPMMWLSGMSRPDFRTINIFRSQHLKGVFDGLFTQVVEFLHDEGLLSLEEQYIDGTKIESVANKYTFVWKGTVQKSKAKLEAQIGDLLSDIEKKLEVEVKEEEKTAADAEAYSRRVKKALEKMDEKGCEDKDLSRAVKKVTEELIPREAKYEKDLEILGDRNSYSKTDHDATFMHLKEDAMNNGQTKPAYNAQIATNNQYIIDYMLFHHPADQGTLIPFLQLIGRHYGAKTLKDAIADSGYGSEMNYAKMEEMEITAFIKYNMFHMEDKRKYKNNPFLPMNLFYNKEEDFYVCPMGQRLEHTYDSRSVSDFGYESTVSHYRCCGCKGCPVRGFCYKGKSAGRVMEVNHKANEYRAKAKKLLTSEEGLHHRSMRPIEPEAAFGDIKHNHGFKRFLLKGKAKVMVEFGLVAMAHNLRKYCLHLGRTVSGPEEIRVNACENQENKAKLGA